MTRHSCWPRCPLIDKRDTSASAARVRERIAMPPRFGVADAVGEHSAGG